MASEAKFKTVLPDNSINAIIDYTGESDVYQSKTNIPGPAEFIHYARDIDFSLPAYGFGQRTTIHIPPSYRLVRNIFLDVELEGVWSDSDLTGFQLIKEFGYRVPGCERMIFKGDHLIFKPFLEAKTEKRRILLADCIGPRHAGNPARLHVYCTLPMPWNNIDPFKVTFPYPAHLTTSSLELDFLFRNKTEVSISPIEMKSATVRFEYGTLAHDQMYKNSVYKYNFDARYNEIYTTVGDTAETSVRITGVRNGEMNQLNFYIRPVLTDPGDIIRNRYRGITARDLKLTYAGQTIWNAPSKTQDFWELVEADHDGNMMPHTNEVQIPATTENPTPYQVGKGHIFTVPIANILESMRNNGYSLGADFKDSDLKLSFLKPHAAAQYEVVVEYLITSVYQFDGQSAKLIY